MKKHFKSILTLTCTAVIGLCVLLAACNGTGGGGTGSEEVDYASQLTLDMNSESKKQEVTVRQFVDGDTTYFDAVSGSALTPTYDPTPFVERSDGFIKARYLAVDTPESTGKIEKWGKTASLFTRGKLENADKVIIESDTSEWNFDSTGYRALLWVWYLPKGETKYHNLNVELLQGGYAKASSTGQNRYGTVARAALEQAMALKYRVFSPASTKDENFYEGEAIELDLKYLRTHIEEYKDQRVRVQGVVTAVYSNSAYIEDLDAESGLYFGMQVYFGYQATALRTNVLQVGYRVEVIGSLQYYEAGNNYQISGLDYSEYRVDKTKHTHVVEEGFAPAFQTVDPATLGSKVTFTFSDEEEGGEVELVRGDAVMASSATFENLTCTSARTSDDSTSGWITLYCTTADGHNAQLYLITQFKDENDNAVTADSFIGRTFTVKGIIGKHSGNYQLNVYRYDLFTFTD